MQEEKKVKEKTMEAGDDGIPSGAWQASASLCFGLMLACSQLGCTPGFKGEGWGTQKVAGQQQGTFRRAIGTSTVTPTWGMGFLCRG